MSFIGRVGRSLASDSTQERPIPAAILTLVRISLRQWGLAGGVRSQVRTLLRAEFPDKQGICREFSRKPTRIARSSGCTSPVIAAIFG